MYVKFLGDRKKKHLNIFVKDNGMDKGRGTSELVYAI